MDRPDLIIVPLVERLANVLLADIDSLQDERLEWEHVRSGGQKG